MVTEHLERSLIELNFALADLMYDGETQRLGIDPEEIGPIVAVMQALKQRIGSFCERAYAEPADADLTCARLTV